MELVPIIHCPLHSTCLPSSAEAGEKPCLPIPFLPGSATNSETVVSGSPVADVARGSSLGESLLDPSQRFRSPPRASEAPDRFLFRRVLAEGIIFFIYFVLFILLNISSLHNFIFLQLGEIDGKVIALHLRLLAFLELGGSKRALLV